LFVRGRSTEKEGTNRRNSKSKAKGRKSGKFCKYYRKPVHLVMECYKLKNKKEGEEKSSQSAEAAVVDSGQMVMSY